MRWPRNCWNVTPPRAVCHWGRGRLEYLIPRIERSFAGIEDIAASIDRISLERKAPPTLAVWRAAVAAAQNPDGEVEEWREQPRLL